MTRILPNDSATLALGQELSLITLPGDLILLGGDLGTGKTTLARGFIRAVAGENSLDVPSPTFTLVQTYESPRMKIAHLDLFRVATVEEVNELGIDDLLNDHTVIVEWPGVMKDILTPHRLELRLEHRDRGRHAVIAAYGSWQPRLERLEALRQFLSRSEWASARREYFEGDASTRRYERLAAADRRAVLMDMPQRPDGPPVRDGKPYSAIAHLAEDVRAVVALNTGLRARGLSAPEIFASNLPQGFLVIEDLGDLVYGRMANARQPMSEPMTAAVKLLADMASAPWPEELPLCDGTAYRLPPYDRGALEIEVELLLDWFWPLLHGEAAPANVREEFLGIWRALWPAAQPDRPHWTLRDYHSPNLLWLPDRRDTARVGLIDTQDAVLGHPAYDLASLLQDARVLVPQEVATDLLDYYCAYRSANESDFDEQGLRRAFVILSTQRITKILGIFARLSKRDGKHQYLRHIGKLNRYLETNLKDPVLSDLKRWYDSHLPLALREKIAGTGQ
ncbi:MAG: tRNA (adenosine(37)-N6)-threonylcarbamoyltransferase complex ATPase subunit type 1 TsaE [Aestuariivirgaceae bacterium]